MNDLRTLLKLGLGLHTAGAPAKRLDVAINGLARLANADAWLAAVLPINRSNRKVVLVLNGGKNGPIAKAAAVRLELGCSQPRTPIGKAIVHRRATPGRVLAFIERKNPSNGESAIHSILRPEQAGETYVTWISIHRSAQAQAFEERERRLVELFHSQSAWILLKTP